MREMSTDRPDQTESAYTVDAGHFQVEMDLVSAMFDRDPSGGGDLRTTGALDENTQLDFGCNFGVTKAAPDFMPFLGFSWRR
jgi:hypothetical protein